MAKKKIREQFEEYFRSGNETMIKKMLEENPWLLHEQQAKMDANLEKQSLILSALGVMNDENGGKSAKIDDILLCLRTDFKQKKNKDLVINILEDAETMRYCRKLHDGWILTSEGERICDNYLNSHIEMLGSEIE